jgi:hypothetical protein
VRGQHPNRLRAFGPTASRSRRWRPRRLLEQRQRLQVLVVLLLQQVQVLVRRALVLVLPVLREQVLREQVLQALPLQVPVLRELVLQALPLQVPEQARQPLAQLERLH